MKMTNRKMVNNIQKLRVIEQKQLPVKVSYAIEKNLNKMDSELKTYNKEREKLLDKYGEKDDKGKLKIDNGGNIRIKKECMKQFNKDINELLDIENEVDIHKFKFAELNGINMSVAELQAIDYMIIEE